MAFKLAVCAWARIEEEGSIKDCGRIAASIPAISIITGSIDRTRRVETLMNGNLIVFPLSLFNHLKRHRVKHYCVIRGHLILFKNTAPFYLLTYYRM